MKKKKNKNNLDKHNPAFALADPFGIDTGSDPAVAKGDTIVSAVVNNTVDKIMPDAEVENHWMQ